MSPEEERRAMKFFWSVFLAVVAALAASYVVYWFVGAFAYNGMLP